MPDNHIKMPAVTPRVQYTANGMQNEFEFPFPICAIEDIQILLDGVVKSSGYSVNGAGDTDGGSVTFSTIPPAGIVITILRQVPYERLSDFLESGDFSAQSLNNELDYLTASLQQLERDQQKMLRFSQTENNPSIELPSSTYRAGKALGFDENGNPIAVDYGLTQAPTSFTATGTGAVSRQMTDKVADMISVRDFGAVGDGVADDTLAFAKALSAHDAVFIPSGIYRITDVIDVPSNKTLMGAGVSSVIKADTNLFTAIYVQGESNILSDFKIDGGSEGILLEGAGSPCVQNIIENIMIENAAKGIVLDGGTDTNYPCYWNMLRNILVDKPTDTGIELTKSGAGDTPNANIFDGVRVYSHGESMSGHGFNIAYGAFYNRFVNCEANVNGTAQSCFTVGAHANETIIQNLYTESTNSVPNLHLKSGSQKTLVTNLLAMSNGAAIWDESDGDYQAVNAGYPITNRFQTMAVADLKATLMRSDTVYLDAPGVAAIDLNEDITVHLVAVTWAAQMFGVAYIMVFETDKASTVITAVESLSAIWAVGLSVLGIYVYKRSEDKRLFR